MLEKIRNEKIHDLHSLKSIQVMKCRTTWTGHAVGMEEETCMEDSSEEICKEKLWVT